MNTIIEHLNQWGGPFSQFAWPMLWQSSVLISILFGVDFVFRRRLRASLRYALWLVVLVKLCLPPALALPTSPAWWLHKSQPAAVPTAASHFTVTYDQGSAPEIPSNPVPVMASRPAMSTAACLLGGSGVFSLVLFMWLLARWAQISRRVRCAATSERLTNLARDTQSVLGFKSKIQVRLTANSMSPAVCGLFHPAILIPRSLADHFSDEQLRTVLLHELIHLRRGDVWVNFLQALLQIVYWWHPLVWLANARIRATREEAVDDAVILALQDEAESYAPTLLAVAKLALRRPLVSLGLVGIMESRHALRQRIERLLDGQTPRRTGLTMASLAGILAFTAVAVPMGDSPENPVNIPAVKDSHATSVVITTDPHRQKVLITADFYALPKSIPKLYGSRRLESQTILNVFNDQQWQSVASFTSEQLDAFKRQTGALNLRPFSRERVETRDGLPATLAVGEGTNQAIFTCCPQIVKGGLKLAFQEYLRRNVGDNIPNVADASLGGTNLIADGCHLAAWPLNEITADKNYLLMIIELKLVTNDPPINASQASPEDTRDPARAYGSGAVVESPFGDAPRDNYFPNESRAWSELPEIDGGGEKLFSRSLRVLPNLPATTTGRVANEQEIETAVSNGISALRIEGKYPKEAFFYSDNKGLLFVRAAQGDMDEIERNILRSFHPAPQVHIKARFLEVPKGTWDSVEKFSVTTTNEGEAMVGILTSHQRKIALERLRCDDKVVSYAEPEVTTTSFREARMRATTLVTVITNAAFETPSNGSNSIVYTTMPLETGPIFDVISMISADGSTIYLRATASLTEFTGYDQPPTNTAFKYIPGTAEKLPPVLPTWYVRRASANIRLWNGQTVAFGKIARHYFSNGKETREASDKQDTELLVLVTVNLVDRAGNLVHSDDQMPFAQDAIPAQTGD